MMQQMFEKDTHEFQEMNLGGDKAGILMRMVIKQLADQERCSRPDKPTDNAHITSQ